MLLFMRTTEMTRACAFWLAKTASVSATLETCWLIGTWQLRVVFLIRETQR